MKHFEHAELAQRYHHFRPRVQEEIINQLKGRLNLNTQLDMAIDVACGTGHSTQPLRAIANKVSGCDCSNSMLAEARRQAPDIEFIHGEAESLPFENGVADLITVGFAFHWFDQEAFLKEARRVLKPNGRLCVYNLVFPGEMVGNEAYHQWHSQVYWQKFPNPPRRGRPLRALIQDGDSGFELVDSFELAMRLAFGRQGLRNYLTTQSNVAEALEQGATLEDVDSWLDLGLAPYFATPGMHEFAYIGQCTLARPGS